MTNEKQITLSSVSRGRITLRIFETGSIGHIIATVDMVDPANAETELYHIFKPGHEYTTAQIIEFAQANGYKFTEIQMSGGQVVAAEEVQYETMSVQITVDDGELAISGAEVIFNGQTKTTPISGIVVFDDVPVGVVPVVISMDDYEIKTANITVVEDESKLQEEVFSLNEYFDTTFTVTAAAGGAPISGATVVYDGVTKLTNGSGIAVFETIVGVKDYSVSKTAYVTQTGTVTVDADEAKAIALVAS